MIADKNKYNTIEGPGFAAFIDLYDSTYAWDQNSDTSVEMLGELYELVEKNTDKFGGHIGNFTGDGFLFLFKNVENCILCLSRIIEQWKSVRRKYVEKYSADGVVVPDDKFLALRTGVSFGNFGSLNMRDKVHYAGSGINKAQRCEAESKEYFKRAKIGELESPNYIFVDSSAENLIFSRTNFYISGQLDAQFKGYVQSNTAIEKADFEFKKQFIYAVWPKKKSGLSGKSAKEMEKLAFAQAKENIGNRLLIASQSVKSGIMMYGLSETAIGGNKNRLLEEAVKSYKDALKVYSFDFAPEDYAKMQNNLGIAFLDQADLFVGEERKQKLQEAIAAYKQALRTYTSSSPEYYAGYHLGISSAIRKQAIMLAGEAKELKLNEAIKSCKKALSVVAFETFPKQYALAQNNLGNVFKIQSNSLLGEKKKQKIKEAIKAYRESLRVYTFESSPEDYGRTQNNLGNALKNEAEVLANKAKSEKIKEAVSAFKEALKVYDFDSSPFYYAGTQNNLAISLKEQAKFVSGKEKLEKLKEAINAYRQALRIYNIDTMPEYYALVNYNLAYVFKEYAKLFTGKESKRKIKKALEIYNESLRVYTSDYYPDRYQFAVTEISKLNSILKNNGVKK